MEKRPLDDYTEHMNISGLAHQNWIGWRGCVSTSLFSMVSEGSMKMSAVNVSGEKVELPRDSTTSFWQEVERHYAADDHMRWKLLALLALRENCCWTFDQLGHATGHTRGHISRCLARVKNELKQRFHSAALVRKRFAIDESDIKLSEQERAAIENERLEMESQPISRASSRRKLAAVRPEAVVNRKHRNL